MNATELLHHLAENAEALSTSERVSGALMVTLLAMLIVFAVLVILIFAIKIMGSVLGTTPKAEVKEAPQAQIAEEEEEAEDEGELVAVISAAVAASLGRNINEIVVTRVRRTDPLPAWTRSGGLN